MRTHLLLAHIALLLVALFYGGNYLIAKHVMNNAFIQPLGFVLLRVVTATALFWLLALAFRPERIARSDVPLFVLCGLTGVCLNQTLFFSGLELTTPVHASLIMTTTPLLVLLFAHLIIRETVTALKVAGVVIGCTGAVILLTHGQASGSGSANLSGDLMVLLNATSYALYLVLVKRLTRKYRPLTVIRWVFTFGLVFVLPVGYVQLSAVEWQTFTTDAWLAVIYVLVCVSFLAYLLNVFALKHVNPSTVSIYIYLQPLFAAILSVLFDMEVLTWTKVVAGVLIFAGVALVSFRGWNAVMSKVSRTSSK
jgi:drug/metabolite transporter (DMT)-like permease